MKDNNVKDNNSDNRTVQIYMRNDIYELSLEPFELARFFTHFNKGELIRVDTFYDYVAFIRPKDVEYFVVMSDNDEIEFDSRGKESADLEKLSNISQILEQISAEIDKINDLAEELESKYSFLSVNVDFSVDDNEVDKFFNKDLSSQDLSL